MLRFSRDQAGQLALLRQQAWLDWLAQDFASRFQQVAAMPQPSLRQRLAADLEQLRAFGVATDSLARSMLEWTALLGPAFWSQPSYRWVRRTLAHPDLTEREKVGLIDGQLTLQAAAEHAQG